MNGVALHFATHSQLQPTAIEPHLNKAANIDCFREAQKKSKQRHLLAHRISPPIPKDAAFTENSSVFCT